MNKNKALSLTQRVAFATPLTRETVENYLWSIGVTMFADDEINDKVLSKLNQEQIQKVEQLLVASQPLNQRS